MQEKPCVQTSRVSRGDGPLVVPEHSLTYDPAVERRQNGLNPTRTIMACGCHLNRSIAAPVQGHGFRLVSLRGFYAPKIPHTHGWTMVGAGVKA
jgi:hypothetical protein